MCRSLQTIASNRSTLFDIFVEDSGGAGRYRGGLGIRRDYRPIGHATTFSGQGERFTNRPWGLFGGGSAATGRFATISDDGAETRLGNKPSTLKIPPDTVISVITAGGGGFGDPAARSISELERDLAQGKFTDRFLDENYSQWQDRLRDAPLAAKRHS